MCKKRNMFQQSLLVPTLCYVMIMFWDGKCHWFPPPLGNHEYILEIFLQPYILPRFKVAQPCLNSALLYTNLACLSVFSVCLFVFLYPINVKTAEPIGPKFCVGHHVTTGKVYESSKFQIVVSIKIRSSLNFLKF